ncbi:group II intron reverse transcriptase/maturase [bacterium]|nr:group II intron reverse transcriptase/maturase [bacterium]
MTEPLNSGDISTRLRRIATLAREHPERAFRSIHHVIDASFLKEAYRRTRKDGAVGVDGRTAAAYAEHLESNLSALLTRLKTGSYRAPPVRRVHIPKGDGGQRRPIGIPTFEDKILQRAVSMVLEALYEQDFLDCSYGFRPGRSAHHALGALRDALMHMRHSWVLELDIQGFFDSLDHQCLRSFLDHRVTDGVLRRVTHKWLKAGVMEGGQVTRSATGSPQGGVISPLLANIYLHYVLDLWFEREVKPRLRGKAVLVRYADDVVVVFEHEHDARRVLAVLGKRLEKYGLQMHPDKTRLVQFGPPDNRGSGEGGGGSGSFDMLGLTHHWARSRKGNWVVKQRTARRRFSRSVRQVYLWCRNNRHLPVVVQRTALAAKLRGHYSYFGITGNSDALVRFYRAVTRAWQKWLGRRSHKAKRDWQWFNRLLDRLPLPRPAAVHSTYRLLAKP